MDSFDINLDNLEPISLKIDDYDSAPSSNKSVNFGGGIELLMNNTKRLKLSCSFKIKENILNNDSTGRLELMAFVISNNE